MAHDEERVPEFYDRGGRASYYRRKAEAAEDSATKAESTEARESSLKLARGWQMLAAFAKPRP